MLRTLPAMNLTSLGQRQRRPVDAAHEEALQDDLVELALRPPHQEAVELRGHIERQEPSDPFQRKTYKLLSFLGIAILRCSARLRCHLHQLPFLAEHPHLDKQLEVHILALRCCAVRLLVAATGLQIDALQGRATQGSPLSLL